VFPIIDAPTQVELGESKHTTTFQHLPDFFVDCLLLFFLWVVSTYVLICLVLLLHGFPSLVFIYRVFFFFSLQLFLVLGAD